MADSDYGEPHSISMLISDSGALHNTTDDKNYLKKRVHIRQHRHASKHVRGELFVTPTASPSARFLEQLPESTALYII